MNLKKKDIFHGLAIVATILAVILFPLTLLALLFWNVWKIFKKNNNVKARDVDKPLNRWDTFGTVAGLVVVLTLLLLVIFLPQSVPALLLFTPGLISQIYLFATIAIAIKLPFTLIFHGLLYHTVSQSSKRANGKSNILLEKRRQYIAKILLSIPLGGFVTLLFSFIKKNKENQEKLQVQGGKLDTPNNQKKHKPQKNKGVELQKVSRKDSSLSCTSISSEVNSENSLSSPLLSHETDDTRSSFSLASSSPPNTDHEGSKEFKPIGSASETLYTLTMWGSDNSQEKDLKKAEMEKKQRRTNVIAHQIEVLSNPSPLGNNIDEEADAIVKLLQEDNALIPILALALEQKAKELKPIESSIGFWPSKEHNPVEKLKAYVEKIQLCFPEFGKTEKELSKLTTQATTPSLQPVG